MLPTLVSLHRVGLAAFSALLLAVVAVGPVLADKEKGHTGTVGFHALRDSETKAGATCRYKGIYPSPGGFSYEGKLKYIQVRPPKVRAISGTQVVGWRFIVQRQTIHLDPVSYDPWVATYRSSIQKDTTNSSTNASFSRMGVDVHVPSSGEYDDPNYIYRVLVKMYWYAADGSIMGTATHLVEWYELIYKGWPAYGGSPPNDTYSDPCEGWDGWEIM
jgi:hypothetical protein